MTERANNTNEINLLYEIADDLHEFIGRLEYYSGVEGFSELVQIVLETEQCALRLIDKKMP
jgi:hypothetical protein